MEISRVEIYEDNGLDFIIREYNYSGVIHWRAEIWTWGEIAVSGWFWSKKDAKKFIINTIRELHSSFGIALKSLEEGI